MTDEELIAKCESMTTIFENSIAGELLSRFRNLTSGKDEQVERIVEAVKNKARFIHNLMDGEVYLKDINLSDLRTAIKNAIDKP